MAWTDKPTEAQINALWYWFKWAMPTAEAKDALDWLENNATRKQVSDEMGRIRDLRKSQSLTRKECFGGKIWEEYFNSKIKEEAHK